MEVHVIRRFLLRNWALLVLFATWQIWVMQAHYNSIVIVSPLAVLKDIATHPRLYIPPAAWTLLFAICGLGCGMSAGTLLAVAAWRSQILARLAKPAALLLSITPVVCLIPLLARIFGYRTRTELVTVAIMTFFPSFVYVSAGLRQLPPMSNELFTVLAASRGHRLLYLAVPASMPNLAIALRIGAAYSILVTVVAEYLMQTGGLGNMFALTSQEFETEHALGASLVAMALSVALYAISSKAEEHLRNRYR